MTTPWDGAPLTISYRRIVVRNSVCVAAITLMVVSRSLLHIFTLYSLPAKEVRSSWLSGVICGEQCLTPNRLTEKKE